MNKSISLRASIVENLLKIIYNNDRTDPYDFSNYCSSVSDMIRIWPGINVIPITNNDTKTFEQEFWSVPMPTTKNFGPWWYWYIPTYIPYIFVHFDTLTHYLGQ